MFRPCALATALAFVTALSGCQDYNFNPVGRCVFQPAVKTATLADVSTADILFVVDDSGSMAGEQAALAQNFQTFIRELADENVSRVQRGLQPLDFHIAITTTSVFSKDGDVLETCGSPEPGFCNVDDPIGPGASVRYACATPGAPCGYFSTSYGVTPACTAGHGQRTGDPYPQGSFVAAPGNPTVLHFTKDLDWANWTLGANPNNPIDVAIRQFSQNIQVGTCGSPQEQGLAAARLAIEKAQRGEQRESNGQRADWLHPSSKLVVVFVGDEDDCSNSSIGVPNVADVALPFRDLNTNDLCTLDANRQNRLTPLGDFITFYQSLRREFASGFIVSAAQNTCTGAPASCLPLVCCGSQCNGSESAAVRFLDFASEVDASFPTAEVIGDSICDEFSDTLQSVAALVKPLDVFTLDNVPAANEVILLRILGSDGRQIKTCERGTDWSFVQCGTRTVSPAPTACIQFVPFACERNPGEAFSAEYLGRVPASGCATGADCDAAFGVTGSTCLGADTSSDGRGTCVCGG
jgi:hypothetical protein